MEEDELSNMMEDAIHKEQANRDISESRAFVSITIDERGDPTFTYTVDKIGDKMMMITALELVADKLRQTILGEIDE